MEARDTARIVTLGLMLMAFAHIARQQACTLRPAAFIESINNTVRLPQASMREQIRPARHVPVCGGDTIQVGNNSGAVLLLGLANIWQGREKRGSLFTATAC